MRGGMGMVDNEGKTSYHPSENPLENVTVNVATLQC
jgi:hypothetical protein